MSQELIEFIKLCLIDGTINDKKINVIKKKAAGMGIDADECDILIDSLCFQASIKQNDTKIESLEATEKSNIQFDDFEFLLNEKNDNSDYMTIANLTNLKILWLTSKKKYFEEIYSLKQGDSLFLLSASSESGYQFGSIENKFVVVQELNYSEIDKNYIGEIEVGQKSDSLKSKSNPFFQLFNRGTEIGYEYSEDSVWIKKVDDKVELNFNLYHRKNGEFVKGLSGNCLLIKKYAPGNKVLLLKEEFPPANIDRDLIIFFDETQELEIFKLSTGYKNYTIKFEEKKKLFSNKNIISEIGDDKQMYQYCDLVVDFERVQTEDIFDLIRPEANKYKNSCIKNNTLNIFLDDYTKKLKSNSDIFKTSLNLINKNIASITTQIKSEFTNKTKFPEVVQKDVYTVLQNISRLSDILDESKERVLNNLLLSPLDFYMAIIRDRTPYVIDYSRDQRLNDLYYNYLTILDTLINYQIVCKTIIDNFNNEQSLSKYLIYKSDIEKGGMFLTNFQNITIDLLSETVKALENINKSIIYYGENTLKRLDTISAKLDSIVIGTNHIGMILEDTNKTNKFGNLLLAINILQNHKRNMLLQNQITSSRI